MTQETKTYKTQFEGVRNNRRIACAKVYHKGNGNYAIVTCDSGYDVYMVDDIICLHNVDGLVCFLEIDKKAIKKMKELLDQKKWMEERYVANGFQHVE